MGVDLDPNLEIRNSAINIFNFLNRNIAAALAGQNVCALYCNKGKVIIQCRYTEILRYWIFEIT